MKRISGHILLIILLCLILLIVAVCLPPFVVINTVIQKFSRRNQIKAFSEFLQSIDGKRYFYHTDRAKLKVFVHTRLRPLLPEDMIFIEPGYGTDSGMQIMYIMLINAGERVPPPFVVRVDNGQVIKRSINNELYNTMYHDKDVQQLANLIAGI